MLNKVIILLKHNCEQQLVNNHYLFRNILNVMNQVTINPTDFLVRLKVSNQLLPTVPF